MGLFRKFSGNGDPNLVKAKVRAGEIVDVETGPKKGTYETARRGQLDLRFVAVTKDSTKALITYRVSFRTDIDKRWMSYASGAESVRDVEQELSTRLYERAGYEVERYASQDLKHGSGLEEFEIFLQEKMKAEFADKGIVPIPGLTYAHVELRKNTEKLSSLEAAITNKPLVTKIRNAKKAGYLPSEQNLEKEKDNLVRWALCIDAAHSNGQGFSPEVWKKAVNEYLALSSLDPECSNKSFFDYVPRSRLREIAKDLGRQKCSA